MQGPVIRKALTSEVEALADIGYAAWDKDLRPLLAGPAANRGLERRRLSHEVHASLDRIIVAELDEMPVGWCSRARGRAYIPYLFVAPLLQNHGIGTLLLNRMEAMLELEGADRVQLNTLADNVRAVSFYQHQGYRILAMRPEDQSAHNPETSVRLEKRLSPYRGPIGDVDE
ncbi:MAG TPA: GNAT family N-acetyltransferase [Devosia sp.]